MRTLSLLPLLVVLATTGCVTAQPVSDTATVSAPPADAMPEPFRVYTAAGAPASLDDLVAAMRDVDVVFLGETHDDATTHALQLRLLEAAHTFDRPVALSLEMFERDVQGVLDEYLAGLVRERDFLAAARPWGNYATDYRPLVEFARERGLPVVAANAPQRYVSRVSRLGPDALAALGPEAQASLPPDLAPASAALDTEFTTFMQEMMAHGHPADEDSSEAAPVHGSAPDLGNLLAAQNLRDASMGYALAEYVEGHPGHLVVHLNGTFHSEGGLGVPEHLARYRPGTRVLVVTARPDDAFPALDPAAFRGTDGGFFVVIDPAAR